MSIAVTSDKVAIRTKGDGQWQKFTYQDSTFTVTLSGLLVFDPDNWTGWDMLQNQLNFSGILFRCSFDDENGDVRTIQGYCIIESSTLSYSTGLLVKNDFSLQGNGKLDMFDGLIPCPSVITTITVDGQEDADGIIHLTYTYTGSVYQVKYRFDNTGNYAYALVDQPIAQGGLALGDHTVEIIPVCVNGYEGAGLVQDFKVTQALTCGSAITAITVTTGVGANATNTHTGAATQMKYRIDGGMFINALIDAVISLSGLSVGNHTIEEVPICSNGLEGTGLVQPFTVTAQPAQSVINYDFENSFPADTSANYEIFVNGVLTIAAATAQTGSFNASVGASILARVNAATNDPSQSLFLELLIVDNTTSTTLTDQNSSGNNVTLTFTFTATADTFTISQLVT